ncbi:MAG: DUF4339 domain-containing protein [Opitutales bacterium]|jgi:hypothetical protein
MELHLHIGEENVGPLSEDEVKAKYLAGEAGPDTLAWADGFDTWYPLSHEHFVSLGLGSSEPAPQAEIEPLQEVTAEPVATASTISTATNPETSAASEPAAEPEEEEAEPEPDPVELAATSAAFDAASAFEPRSRDELKTEMIRLKHEHTNVLLPEIGRKAMENGIRVSGATEILNRIEAQLKKGDSAQLEAAYVSYAQAIVQAGISEPTLDDLIERERHLSEDMLNLHAEAKRLGVTHKPGGALKWILLTLALLAIGGTAALVYFNTG